MSSKLAGCLALACVFLGCLSQLGAAASHLEVLEYVDDRMSKQEYEIFEHHPASYWQAKDQDTLKQVLFIHRHGDRTPIVFPSKDNLAHEPFWTFHGLSQLTNRGKARLHMLGSIIRMRYNKFLGGTVNKNSLKTRASGSLRCIESAQVFLSSFLGLNVRGSPDARALTWDRNSSVSLSQIWQPASIKTLAAKWDGMLNEGAQCKLIDDEYIAIEASDEFKAIQEEYKHEAQVLRDELDNETDHFYRWFWAASLLEVERSYFGRKMKPSLLKVYDRVGEAGDRALVLLQSSLNMRRYRAGLLVNDMLKNMEEMRAASTSPFLKKFVHYSAHDVTLIFLMGVLEQIGKLPVRPDYAANIMIELHKDNDNNQEWFVKFFYMHQVPSAPIELHMEACEQQSGGRCMLDKFVELMQKYRVTSWQNWMRECGNSLSEVDPYSENF